MDHTVTQKSEKHKDMDRKIIQNKTEHLVSACVT